MGNCNCFEISNKQRTQQKNSDINVEGNSPINTNNPQQTVKSQIPNNENQINNNNNVNSNTKGLQRGVQNPTQNNIKKNQGKSRFDSGGLEMGEVGSSLEKENSKDKENLLEKSKKNESPNSQFQQQVQNQPKEKDAEDLPKKKLTEVMKVKDFDREYHIKKDCINVVFLGERCCGKSSIVYQYINNKFEPYYIQTMFKETFRKEVSYEEKKVNLNIIVTSGVEQYQEDYTEVYRNCDFFVVCYDVTSNDSFLKAKDIISKDLLPYIFLYNEKFSNIVLIGNKTDLREKCVDINTVMEYANKYKIVFYESSAKNNNNITSTFNKIIELYHEAIMEI